MTIDPRLIRIVAAQPQGGEGVALEMDIVTHDVRKFFGLLLKKNGYVLEQHFSPLILHTTSEHKELKAICNPRQFDTSPNPLPGRGGEGNANHPSPRPSPLSEETRAALNDLLVRVRLGSIR